MLIMKILMAIISMANVNNNVIIMKISMYQSASIILMA
jgi:hypothetical protein